DQDGEHTHDNHQRRRHGYRLVKGKSMPAELAQHLMLLGCGSGWLRYSILLHDSIEQLRINGAVDLRLAAGSARQLRIGIRVQYGACTRDALTPAREFRSRDHMHQKPHVRETIAAEIRRQ